MASKNFSISLSTINGQWLVTSEKGPYDPRKRLGAIELLKLEHYVSKHSDNA